MIPPRAPRQRVGSGFKYTDLERLRVEYWLYNTDISVAEMARRLGRSVDGLQQYLYRSGAWVREIRGTERAWSGG